MAWDEAGDNIGMCEALKTFNPKYNGDSDSKPEKTVHCTPHGLIITNQTMGYTRPVGEYVDIMGGYIAL